ncbi:hypothetical protein NL350_28175, partial [Klebsiella pneumoniae]|nr:hypothetical protein [Klebsiella pneumoniae]
MRPFWFVINIRKFLAGAKSLDDLVQRSPATTRRGCEEVRTEVVSSGDLHPETLARVCVPPFVDRHERH